MASCSFAAISLHSLLTEAEFSSCWVTLQIDQSNHRLRSKLVVTQWARDTWPATSPGSPPPLPAKTTVIDRLSEIIYV
jgi:hypothetical protein